MEIILGSHGHILTLNCIFLLSCHVATCWLVDISFQTIKISLEASNSFSSVELSVAVAVCTSLIFQIIRS